MELLKNAKVQVAQRNGLVSILIEDRVSYSFNQNSNITRMLQSKGLQTVTEFFNGGSYVIIDNQLVDYRPSNYKGYICDDETLELLFEKLGCIKNVDIAVKKSMHLVNPGNIILAKQTCINEFDVDYAPGDDQDQYTSGVYYQWSPFQSFIKAQTYIKDMWSELEVMHSYDKIELAGNWVETIDNQMEKYPLVLSEVFKDLLDALAHSKPVDSDFESLLLVASYIDDDDMHNAFQEMRVSDETTKYDLFCYALDVSNICSQYGHIFKFIKTLFSSVR